MKLSAFVDVMQALAPAHLCEPWDNVGLLAGDPEHVVSHVMTCIDLSHAVVDEAVARGCDTLVCYHPPIFKGLKTLAGKSPMIAALRHNLAVYSPHTAWDVAPGGANDALADALGMQGGAARQSLRPAARGHKPLYKLAVFTPPAATEAVCDAMFAAGAGHIGGYSHCSFRSQGDGTFTGAAHTQPTVGRAGERVCAAEHRVEVVVPEANLQAAITALRTVHPYEEPAFDVYALHLAAPEVGIGRTAPLATPQPATALIARIKEAAHLQHVLHAAPPGDATPLVRAAVCVGAGGALLDDALHKRCDVFVTGELRHHDALRATARGMHVLCLLHANSEHLGLQRLSQRLAEAASLPVAASRADHDPFAIV